jgi:hypothetical protein
MRLFIATLTFFAACAASAQQAVGNSLSNQTMIATQSIVDPAYDPNFVAATCQVARKIFDDRVKIDVDLFAADGHTHRSSGSIQVELPLKIGLIARSETTSLTYDGTTLREVYRSADGQVFSVDEYVVDSKLDHVRQIKIKTVSNSKPLLQFECSDAQPND